MLQLLENLKNGVINVDWLDDSLLFAEISVVLFFLHVLRKCAETRAKLYNVRARGRNVREGRNGTLTFRKPQIFESDSF